jgi:hypothetical protein
LGKRGFLHFLQHFNNGGGILKRTDYTSHVAKMACIINFRPLLKWSIDNEIMVVIKNPAKGLISYQDFGAPPDDDIDELQTLARKIRRGASKVPPRTAKDIWRRVLHYGHRHRRNSRRLPYRAARQARNK